MHHICVCVYIYIYIYIYIRLYKGYARYTTRSCVRVYLGVRVSARCIYCALVRAAYKLPWARTDHSYFRGCKCCTACRGTGSTIAGAILRGQWFSLSCHADFFLLFFIWESLLGKFETRIKSLSCFSGWNKKKKKKKKK